MSMLILMLTLWFELATLVFYLQSFCFLWHCIVWHKDDPIYVRGKCCIHPM